MKQYRYSNYHSHGNYQSKVRKRRIVVCSIALVAVAAIVGGVALALHFNPLPITPTTSSAASSSGTTESKQPPASSGEPAVSSTASQTESTPSKIEGVTPSSPGEYPYQSSHPDLYVPVKEKKRVVGTAFLTFDDGPSEQTDKILDILKEKNAKACFYVIYHEGAEAERLLKRIVEEGHTLGVHTYTHRYDDIYASVDAYLDDFQKISDWIEGVTGVKPTMFRFPGGSENDYNKAIYQELIAEMTRRGYVYNDWNIATGDADRTDVPKQECIDNVLNNSAPMYRCFILMHDSTYKGTTVEALPAIIDGLRQQDFTIEPLTDEVVPCTFQD